eukprot:scaffold1417_cov114-Skeletonema_dohrnii-CCMP3373.AAC.4
MPAVMSQEPCDAAQLRVLLAWLDGVEMRGWCVWCFVERIFLAGAVEWRESEQRAKILHAGSPR